MRRFILFLAPVLLVLPGCVFGPGLAGDWSGTIECEDEDSDLEFDIELELEAEGGGVYAGEMSFLVEQEVISEGDLYVLIMEVDLDVEVETSGGGEQGLDMDTSYADSNCSISLAGQDLGSDECTEMGLDEGDLENSGASDLVWDGADTIEVDDDDCEGEIER